MADRKFTDEDIVALTEAIKAGMQRDLAHRSCRFADIDPDHLAESVEFYRRLNRLLDQSGWIVWKTSLVAIVGGVLVLVWYGATSKIKGLFGGP